MAHLEADGRAGDVLRVGVALQRFAVSRGHTALLGALRRAVSRAGPVPAEPLARGLLAATLLIQFFVRKDAAESAAAKDYAERALAIARELGEPLLEARARAALAGALYVQDDSEAARALVKPAIAAAREAGDTQLLAEVLQVCAASAVTAAEQVAWRVESLECAMRSGDLLLACAELSQLGGLDLHAGRIDEASDRQDRAVKLAEWVGGDLLSYFMCTDQAVLRLIQGRHEEAAPIVRRCLLVARRIGVQIDASEVIFAAACCAAWRGDHATAARLHGVADADIAAALAAHAINWSDAEQRLREREQGRLRELMGEDRYAGAYRAGARMTPQQAVELALGREPGPLAGDG